MEKPWFSQKSSKEQKGGRIEKFLIPSGNLEKKKREDRNEEPLNFFWQLERNQKDKMQENMNFLRA